MVYEKGNNFGTPLACGVHPVVDYFPITTPLMISWLFNLDQVTKMKNVLKAECWCISV